MDCAVLGTTSETSYLKSTLPDNVPLITATGSLPMQNITLEVIASSESQTTTSNVGRSENVKCQTIVQLSTNDYIEVFIQNSTNPTNITVSELNTILIPLS